MGDFVIKLEKYTGDSKEVIIPDGVTVIGKKAFDECKTIERVVIPEGVVTIEESAFEDCENLRSLVLPRSLREIGEKAFEDCKSLEEVILPENVRQLCSEAFGDCENLRGLTLPYRNVKLPVSMLEDLEVSAHNLAAIYVFQTTKTAERFFNEHADAFSFEELAEEMLNALEGHETPRRCCKCETYFKEHKDEISETLASCGNALFAKVEAKD